MATSLFGLDGFSDEAFSAGPFRLIISRGLGVSSAFELDGATVLFSGEEMELAIDSFFESASMLYEPIPAIGAAEAEKIYLAGSADVLVVPSRALAGVSLPSDHVLLPEEIGDEGPDLGGLPTPQDDDITGTAADDVIYLLRGNDRFDGRGGDDTVYGQAGRDVLKGGRGGDILDGGGGADRLLGGAGGDTLAGGAGKDKVFGGGGGDVLSGGGGADFLQGGGGNDSLSGGGGNDRLEGGNGRDTLDGGRGNDTLTGGKGADIFVFETFGQKNQDVITDFRKGVDMIELDSADYTVAKSGGNIVLRFGGGESLTLEGVSSGKNLDASISAPKPPKPADGNPALVFDLGGKLDKAFNQSAYEGAERWAQETGGSYTELEVNSEAQRELALRRFAEASFEPIVAIGSAMAEAVDKAAVDYTGISFAIVDAVVDQPNVSSYTFAEHEGAYLMGIVAAMASESETVGFIGGMDVPMTRRYSTAFEQGVLAANPDAEVLVSMAGTTPAAWNDPVKGGELAKAQMAKGADVIFAAAGGTSYGVLQAVADAGALGIGADINLGYLHPGTMLTSMVKRVDVVVEKIFSEGTGIVPGTHQLGLAEGAIGYAYDDFNKGLLTAKMRAALDLAIDDILSGSVTVQDYYDI